MIPAIGARTTGVASRYGPIANAAVEVALVVGVAVAAEVEAVIASIVHPPKPWTGTLPYADRVSSTPSDSPAQPPTPCGRPEPAALDEPAAPSGLTRIRAVPVGAQAGVLLALLAVGLWLGGPVGAGLLLLVAAVMLAGLAVAWGGLPTPERLLRFAAAFLVIALALVRMFPR